MPKGLYPGSFDPMTMGHIDIIDRIHNNFDELVVLVARSAEKSYLFSESERLELARTCLSGFSNVRVDGWAGLTVDYAHLHNIPVIVRGIRAVSDFEAEMAMAHMNKKISKNNPSKEAGSVETMLVFASPELDYLSSRMVKEVAKHHGHLEGLVPPAVLTALEKKIGE